jgi:hypothetical protein
MIPKIEKNGVRIKRDERRGNAHQNRCFGQRGGMGRIRRQDADPPNASFFTALLMR